MKPTYSSILIVLLILSVTSVYGTKSCDPKLEANAQQWIRGQSVEFVENRGQLSDMNGKPVPYVLFKAQAVGLDMYITEKGLTYVFLKTKEEHNTSTKFAQNKSEGLNVTSKRIVEKHGKEKISTEMAWINMHLKNASIRRDNIIKEGESTEHFNYFYPHCPEGIYGVKQYKRIVIKDVYPGIDWVFYNSSNTGVKYDFVVHPGADPSQIKLIYESEKNLQLNSLGGIEIETAFGTLTENAPYCYIQETGFKVNSCFKKNIIDQYNVEINFNLTSDCQTGLPHSTPLTSTLIIDPQLVWGTLYGGLYPDGIHCITVDNNNNLFAGGYTFSTNLPVQTAGTYIQNTNVGSWTGFILKFDNAGNRLWATYYGGSNIDEVQSIAIDRNNNLFAGGYTSSVNFPTQTLGSFFQGANAGSLDAFILKFDNAGNRLWATYYGGPGDERIMSLAIDGNNNLFGGGYTYFSTLPVQNAGTFFQGTSASAGNNDAFILKFDNAGNRLWATHYGGSGSDIINTLAVDGNNNLFAGGTTNSPNFPVQTAGTFFQSANAGLGDAFILKFDNAGNRLWATNYGGSGYDLLYSLAVDGNNNLFAGGTTNSPNFPVQTAGTFFQGTNAGNVDVFILKFDNTGNRIWATYYGGSGSEDMAWNGVPDDLVIDDCGNVYIGLETYSSNMPLVNPGCGFFDGTYGGVYEDCFIAKFSNSGTLLWSSYIGGTRSDFRVALAVDNNNNLFMAGEFLSYTLSSAAGLPLVNLGSGTYFDNTPNGADDSFILKFTQLVTYTQSQVNSNACTPCNGSATVNLTCSEPKYSYVWSNGSSTLNSTNTTNTISGLCPGSYTVTAMSSCNKMLSTAFTITGIVCGGITANVNSVTLCSGVTACPSLTATVANGTVPYTYSWSNGATTQNINPCPVSTTTYTVTIKDAGGNTSISTAVVTINPAVTLTTAATNTTCNGAANGSVLVNAGSGTPGYIYNWSNGVSGSTVSGLGSGIYTVTVTDSKGCVAISTAGIISPPALTAQFTKGTSNCIGCDCKQWIMVTGKGGTAPYAYQWPDGYMNRYKNGLCPGSYNVKVTDKNGCSVNAHLNAP